jgi:hypothetical protein
MNRLVEGNPTPTCRPGTTIRIATSAEVVIVVLQKRALECFILHYSALVVWLGFYTRNYGEINLLRGKKWQKHIRILYARLTNRDRFFLHIYSYSHHFRRCKRKT